MRIEGTVKRITYHNKDNGYSVFRLKYKDDEITCVGFVSPLREGDFLNVEGEPKIHKIYGEQIVASSISVGVPSDVGLFAEYLASSGIRGIGPVTAKRIVSAFGEDTFRVMEEDPEKLAKVKGISKKSAASMSEQMVAMHGSREEKMFWLHLGISNAYAMKIKKQYGDFETCRQKISENPYILIDDIHGIGFQKADEIAREIGIEKDSPFRIRSGLLFLMDRNAVMEGHTVFPKDSLVNNAAKTLGIDQSLVFDGISSALRDGKLMESEINGNAMVCLPKYNKMEDFCANKLMMLDHSFRCPSAQAKVTKEIEEIEEHSGSILDPDQRSAVIRAIMRGVTIITGGPGTGKTTLINILIRYFKKKHLEIELAAPTGRAAKRMSEATGCPAKTIHRMIGTDDDPQLFADVVIIDETSMVDILLMYRLLKATEKGMQLILVGDVDQLPSVGPGSVLKDMINSGKFPVAKLTKIHRQAEQSHIVVNAHKINNGEWLDWSDKKEDFFLLERDNSDEALSVMMALILRSIPNHFHISPYDIQVMAPMKKGPLGVDNLNNVLQQHLNPSSPQKAELAVGSTIFREGDKVMQIKNNYDLAWKDFEKMETGKGVFNGDAGVIKKIDPENETMVVEFEDGRTIKYEEEDDIKELMRSFAITVHKSQGSEYPAIIMPVVNGGPPMLYNRNLLYTFVTRAKSCVTFVGSKKVVCAMAKNTQSSKRFSALEAKLKALN